MMTIETFGQRLRSGETTSAEITAACLSRIELESDRLNAFTLTAADLAMAQARAADRELVDGHDRGPLHGVPVSVKDLIDIQGMPTTAASRVRDRRPAGRDAPAVARLREAGAVFVGKTNLHEFAYGTTSEDSAFGPVRNPHDPTRSAGGSSGGSAVSLAADMALASLGTDTGGSIRIPAAACGVVGLKPAYGEIPTSGVVPLSPTLDHLGPLAGTVTDVWLVYRALAGSPLPPGPHRPAVALPPLPAESLRLGVVRPYFCDLLDGEVRNRFEQTLEALRAAGARVHERGIPHASSISAIYLMIQLSDAAAYHAATLQSVPERYTAPVRLRLEMGRYVLAEDYVRALAGREVLRREVHAALADLDALLLPTLPIPAPPLGAPSIRLDGVDEPVRGLMLRLTQLFNLTGHPAISLPCGRTSGGLPCGLQLVGGAGATRHLLQVARTCEACLEG
jgi:aspartyl-tRNA(Asn)/glutamyl-tRNA(Gln) amidotransferase subunit A